MDLLEPASRLVTVYGVNVRCTLPLTFPLLPGTAPERLSWTHGDEAPEEAPRFGEPVFVAAAAPDAPPPFSIYREGEWDLIQTAFAGDFYIGPRRIHACLGTGDPRFGEMQLLSSAMALWLEREELPVLHGSGVVVEGGAVIFLASSQGGKSSLAATMLQAGYPLLTDDLVPLEAREEGVSVRPGYPQMRFWPEQARHFAPDAGSLERVHPTVEKRLLPVGAAFGSFRNRTVPLRAIYLPDRGPEGAGADAIRSTLIRPHEAVMELVRHSFLPRLLDALGLHPRRMAAFARLRACVPVKRLCYPSGMDLLPAVREFILADLAGQ